MSPQFQKRPCRPRDHLAAAGKLYPEAWKLADEFRADRGRDGLPDWPQWCYLPIAGWYAIVSGGGANRVPAELIGDVSRLAALGAWRATQGIYRFDPALYRAIVDTPVDGDLPHDVLYHLPEWCVYVETPEMTWNDGPLHGFFAHLEWDANSGRPELRLLLDAETDLAPMPLHLGPWTLAESISRMSDVANIQAMGAGLSPAPFGTTGVIRALVEPLVSLLLYLCSQAAEIGDGNRVPGNPAPTRTKKGWRMFPPDKPAMWDVGVRLGAALRRAYHAEQTGQGGTQAGPRPHIRRAHWHGFRSGPMKRGDGSEIPTVERKFALRWLPPIPINVGDVADMPATIRPVRP